MIPLETSAVKRLSIGCSHAHTFGRCVNRNSGIPYWVDYTDQRTLTDSGTTRDLDQKLGFIRQRLVQIGTTALQRGLKVQCITEHPQFGFYGIPFDAYWETVKPVIDDFENGKYERPLRMPWGMEVELVPGTGKDVGVLVTEQPDTSTYGLSEILMLERAEILVGGIHQKFYQYHEVETARDYGEILIAGALALGRTRDELQRNGHGSKVLVLAHPWYCASDLRDYNGRRRLSMDLGIDMSHRVAEALIEQGVAPEFNIATVKRGSDELSAQYTPFRGDHTLIGTYLRTCDKTSTAPLIAIGTDAHTVDRVGGIDLTQLGAAGTDVINAAQSVSSLFLRK